MVYKLPRSDQSVPSPNVVRLWAMVLLIGGERWQDLRMIKNGRSVKGHLYRVNSSGTELKIKERS